MDRFIHRYFLIILVRIFRWAIFYTGSTTCAFILKDIPGLFSQAYLEGARFSFYTVYFSIGEDLYIGMPADLDQLWSEYSHATVIGRKGLVQLRHVATNTWRFFNQVDLKPGRGKIKRGLNAADSSANNHYVSEIIVSETLAHLFSKLFLFHFL